MTRELAISILKDRSCVDCAMMCAYPLERPEGDCEYADAIRMAIEALEEQMRMTREEVINELKYIYESFATNDLSQEALMVAIEALKKLRDEDGGDE